MNAWKDFLKQNDELSKLLNNDEPGPVMLNFVNRYLEPLDSVLYRVEYEGKTLRGMTRPQSHTVEVKPSTMRPINVSVWSKRRGEFKLIAQINPRIKQRLLVSLRMKTFRHYSKTEAHPASTNKESSLQKTDASTGDDNIEVAWEVAEQGVDVARAKNTRQEPEHRTRRLPSEKISTDQLKKIFPAAEEKFLSAVADELNTNLEKYKLDTVLRRAHFFAQVRQEAGESLSPKEECLNYKPEVLIEKFSYYKKKPDEARNDGRIVESQAVEKNFKGGRVVSKVDSVIQRANQEAIANKAYGDRERNGSIQSGDGWKFRGRGIFQLTFRGNYAKFSKEYPELWSDGAIGFEGAPDKVCEFPYFVRSAVWFWVQQSVYLKADGGAQDADIDNVTRKINGPTMDAADKRRHNFHELCYPAFK